MAENKTDSKDIIKSILLIRQAKEEKFFGEITLSYRNGEVLYYRKNEVRKLNEFDENLKAIDNVR
jgi:hypothetical protein